MLEDICDRDMSPQQLTHAVSKANADNRVSSQLKEVIGETDPGDLEGSFATGHTMRALGHYEEPRIASP